jgi:hypothetical protein
VIVFLRAVEIQPASATFAEIPSAPFSRCLLMKSIFTKWLPLLLLLLVLAGFGYLAMMDVPVHQSTVEKTIPNSHFFQ